jgi:hypothetical protein
MKTALPILFLAVSSLAAVACAAPTTESSGAASNDQAPADEKTEMTASEAIAKIPSSSMVADPQIAMPEETKELAPLQLYIPELKITYPVAAFNFSVSNDMTIGSVSGGAGGGKAQFSSLSVHVTPTLGTPSLMTQLAKGAILDKVVLFRAAQGKNKQIDIATFGMVAVDNMFTQGHDQALDEAYEFKFGTLDLKAPSNDSTKLDVTKNISETTASTDTCSSYGPFVQAHASWPIPKPGVQVDRFSILMTNESNLGSSSATAGAGAGKAHLDLLSVDSIFDKNAACALRDIHLGRNLGSMQFAIATAFDSAKGKLSIPYKWESCVTFATGISFSGGGTHEIHQSIAFEAGGIIRTDAVASKTKPGELVDGAPAGWSFVNNKAITSCSEIPVPQL